MFVRLFLVTAGVHHPEGGDHQFLRADAGEQAHVHLPVEAERGHGGLHGLSEPSDGRMFLLVGVRGAFMVGEVGEEPQGDGEGQDGRRHLLQVLAALLPGMASDGLAGRDAVGRQLHHEGEVVVLDKTGKDFGAQERHHDAEQVDPEQCRGGVVGEESPGQEHENRQAAGAGHERDDGDGNQAGLPALDGARRHDGRHIAAEAHDHGDERLAMETDAVHQLVHDEGGAGHVATVFHQRDEQVQDQDVRQEHEHAAHSADDPVHHEVFQPSVLHVGGDEIAEFPHEPVNPVHRVLAQGEGGPEHQPQQEDENRKSQPAVRHDGVDPVGQGPAGPLLLVAVIGLGQGALDEGVFGVHDGGFGIDSHQFPDAGGLFLPGCDDGVPVGKPLDERFDVLVRFQVLDGQVAGGIAGADILICGDEVPEADDAFFQFRPVVDVDVPGQAGIRLLIDPDDGVEEFADAFAVPGDRRTDRRPEQPAQLLHVERIPLGAEFVVHVQGHDGPQVHVDELGGQVEVPLDVGGVHDIDHHVRHRVDEVLPDVEFFGGIG